MLARIFLFFIFITLNACTNLPNNECPSDPYIVKDSINENNGWTTHASINSLANSNLAIPPEISRIKNGAISYFVGGHINDGLISWSAFDADREIFIHISGGIGPRFQSKPDENILNSNQLFRIIQIDTLKRSELITIVGTTNHQQKLFSCLANQLSHAPIGNQQFRRTDTLFNSFEFIRDGVRFDYGKGIQREFIKDKIDNLISDAIYKNK